MTAAAKGDEIDDIFKSWRSGPGGVVGVIQNGQLEVKRAYGMASVAKKVPMTTATNFDLASVSKQFTATAVLLAAQSGKLQLTDPLGKFLPGLPAYASKVPLESLLNMTSGFPEYDDTVAVTVEDLIETLKDEKPTFAAGKRYEYLNMNYALLTFVMQKVYGCRFGEILQRDIFQPLKMKDTVFLGEEGQKIANRATGYQETAKSWKVSRNDVPGVGDGNVFSNVEDLSRWAIDLLAGSSIIDERWIRQAWTSGVTSKGSKTGYGYGFEIDSHRRHKRISHTGSWNGTSTYIALYPKLGLGVIVLSNREDEDAYGLGEEVEDLYLP